VLAQHIVRAIHVAFACTRAHSRATIVARTTKIRHTVGIVLAQGTVLIGLAGRLVAAKIFFCASNTECTPNTEKEQDRDCPVNPCVLLFFRHVDLGILPFGHLSEEKASTQVYMCAQGKPVV